MQYTALKFALVAGCVALSACGRAPIVWEDPTFAASSPAGSRESARLLLDSAGHAHLVADSSSPPMPQVAGMCDGTVRTVDGSKRTYSVWWGLRPDSSVVLYTAVSSDRGAHWDAPIVVDTTDVRSRGCVYPPPAIATVDDDLHVAYSMTAPEGAGVFFAHFMGGMFHSPVPVLYGDRAVATAIAVDGDNIAVAYEQPNGRVAEVVLAVSQTQGHMFETRVAASRDVDGASDPLVAIRGRDIAVSWIDGNRRIQMRAPRDSSTRTRMVRTGRLAR